MAKKPKDKTLGQIKMDISRAEEGKKEVLETYGAVADKKVWPMSDWILMIAVLILFAFAIVERSRMLSLVAGLLLAVMVIKMYAAYLKK